MASLMPTTEQPPSCPAAQDAEPAYKPNDLEAWAEAFGSYNVRFDYKFKDHKSPDGWHAVLLVRAKSIEKLMKCGFHVTEANVRKHNGPVITKYHDDWSDFTKTKWKAMRAFDVGDLALAQNWKAMLWVYAEGFEPLSKFRITELSFDNCSRVDVWSKGRTVYHYSSVSPEDSFNALYDTLPLSGLWPWPKEGGGVPRRG